MHEADAARAGEEGAAAFTAGEGGSANASAGVATGADADTSAGAGDKLAREMAAFDASRAWTTEKLLKESAMERTELVTDAAGRRYIRKYIDLEGAADAGSADAGGEPAAGAGVGAGVGVAERHPYEMLPEIGCPFLPQVRMAEVVADKLVVVADYVPGCDLRALVEEGGPLGLARAQRMARCVCMALSALHEAANPPIVHRDVNPGNIIANGEVAVLVDLGVARVHRDDAIRDTRLLGTAGYTAPEQYGFRQTDARADIYSLGMVVRFMLTGREPGCEARDGEMPASIAVVVEKATSFDPSARYQSAREMGADLEAAFEVAQGNRDFSADACTDAPVKTHIAKNPAAPSAPAPPAPPAAKSFTAAPFATPPAVPDDEAAAASPAHIADVPSPDTAFVSTPPKGGSPKATPSKAAHILWRMWQALVGAFTVIVDAGLVAVSVNYARPGVSVFAALMGVFFITIPLLALANPGDWLARLHLFSKSRHPRIWRAFAVALASIAAFIILAIAVQAAGLELGEPFQ